MARLGVCLLLLATTSGWVECATSFAEIVGIVKAINSVDLSVPALVSYMEQGPQKTFPEDADCLAHLKQVQNGTLNLEQWALTMLDSGSKIPVGLLQENQRDLGKFDECVSIQRNSFAGLHCLVTLVLGVDLPPAPRPEDDAGDDSEGIYVLLKSSSISGCYPSSCSSNALSRAMNKGFSGIVDRGLPKYVTMQAHIDDVDCHTRRTPPLSAADWVVLCLCSIIILMALIGTAIDLLNVKIKGSTTGPVEILKCFSVYMNGKELFCIEPKVGEIQSIHGIRFLSIGWVVLIHKHLFSLAVQPLLNPYKRQEVVEDWANMIILNGTLAVDTFFLLSGLLNAYVFFRLADIRRRVGFKDVLISFLHRYFRLSVSYFILIGIVATVLYQVGSGPLWDRLVGDARHACQVNWWANVAYLNNYLTVEHPCMGHTWYLAADMQMALLAPLLLLPLLKWPLVGLILLALTTVGGVVSPFAVSYVNSIQTPIPLYNGGSPEYFREMSALYFPTHTRFISYVIGLSLGYFITKLRTKDINFQLNNAKTGVGWVLCGIFLLYSLFGGHSYYLERDPDLQLSASFYIAFFRLLWVLGVGWIILACDMGHAGFLNAFLSMKVFWPLSKLSYCIFLTHLPFILVRTGFVRAEIYFTNFNLAEEYVGDLVFIIGFSLVLYLLVEGPALSLDRFFFGAVRKAQQKVEDATEAENEIPQIRVKSG